MKELTIEQKAKAYDNVREKIAIRFGSNVADEIFFEYEDNKDEKIRKTLVRFHGSTIDIDGIKGSDIVAWLEKQKEPEDKGEISDGYHTFNELYYYRMLYNAAFFNTLPKEWVHKSKKHHNGEECFGGGWFIVMAKLPTGQVSNHYELKDWDLFQIPEKETSDEWDGHTPQEAAERLHKYLLEKQVEQKPLVFKAKDWYVSKVDGKIHNMTYNHADKKELKESDNYCRENCKGFQETGKCFFDDKCEAYKTYKQKSADKVEHKFHEGEWIVQKDLGTYKIVEVCESWYEVISYNDGIRYSIGFNKENDCHLWTIQDAKDGDVLVTVDNESPFIYKGCLDPNHPDSPVAYCGIDCEGYFCKGGDKFDHWWTESKVQPATKEQCDLLFQKMHEAGYEWDADRKELRKIENEIEIPFGAKDSELQEVTYYIPQGFHAEIDDNKVVIKKGEKPTAWSEEDEKILNDIDVTLFEEKSTPNVKYWKFMNWLKSIKERLSS